MIFPPVVRAAEVVKPRMTLTLPLAATRSPAAMVKVTTVGVPIPVNATPVTWSMLAEASVRVVMETVLAAAAAAAFLSPATGHEMGVEDVPANAVVKVITRTEPLHDA